MDIVKALEEKQKIQDERDLFEKKFNELKLNNDNLFNDYCKETLLTNKYAAENEKLKTELETLHKEYTDLSIVVDQKIAEINRLTEEINRK